MCSFGRKLTDLLDVNWDLDVRHIVDDVALERLGIDGLAYSPGHLRGLWDMVLSKDSK